MITKMLKSIKENNISKSGQTKKKQQLEKVKRAVKAELVKNPAVAKVGVSLNKKQRVKKIKVIDVDLEDEPEATEETIFENSENESESKTCDVGPEQTIFINNLPPKMHRVKLAKLFAPYGKIMFILFGNIVWEKLYAYVVLDSVEAADKALDLDGTLFENRNLTVRKPSDRYGCLDPKNTVIITSEIPNITKKSLHQTFSTCGDIEFIQIFKCSRTEFRSCLQFKSPDAVDSALKIKCTVNEENPISVEQFRCVEKKETPASHIENTVFVKNLNKTTTSKSVKKFFSTCGKVNYVNILKSFPDKVSKGRGFVCFKSPDAVNLALALNDTVLEEKSICVERKQPRSLNRIGLGIKAPNVVNS